MKTTSGQMAQQESLFFNLPLELRWRILDYTFANLRVSFNHINMRIGAVYPPPRTDEHNYLRPFLRDLPLFKDLSLILRLKFWIPGDFNPWVDPVHSGIAFLEELPKGLHEAHTVLQMNRYQYLMLDKIKLELWRIARELNTSPGEEMKEDWLCYDIEHKQPQPVDDCGHPYYHWRMMVTPAAHRRNCVLHVKEGKGV
ncbi:hypothetical protein PtrCC142_005963 [Pyrenophora tritici-repentis]|uniref:Uncharacterized protein n=1 Tax=Pyrenophora tritici-repentis TaxID=45151 RepID=A0A922NPT5_9PLEO|nr:hypothetical protein Ptr86124_000495 [Pyrenophora tritici-repentis]KAI1573426.1 hypothetical protein PtrEW4_003746 [Pyrenophora tritici-repentis]KAI1601552.1 hypothetical protein PtrCC142_005963 [Pyrenophora tritici-repentis]KAI1687347.1 hypothetical protein KJE20_00524 [Pyrenophora tritici-repentis]